MAEAFGAQTDRLCRQSEQGVLSATHTPIFVTCGCVPAVFCEEI